MKRVAFATCSKYRELATDDLLAVEELRKLGIEAVPAVWNEERDWSAFDAVLIRSTWDYWFHYERFLSWLGRLEKAGIRVWNSVPIVRWNSNKLYLRDLAAKGIPVVPTIWLERNEGEALSRLPSSFGDEVILKPIVSGGSASTFRLNRDRLSRVKRELSEAWKFGPAMIQPFLRAIETEGEYSFLFFGGKFSHAVLKSSAKGDFRVQSSFGGTSRRAQVEESWIRAAERVLIALEDVPLYARVDMVRDNEELLLMELELIEPNLFLSQCPGSAAVFAEKLARTVSAQMHQPQSGALRG